MWHKLPNRKIASLCRISILSCNSNKDLIFKYELIKLIKVLEFVTLKISFS